MLFHFFDLLIMLHGSIQVSDDNKLSKKMTFGMQEIRVNGQAMRLPVKPV